MFEAGRYVVGQYIDRREQTEQVEDLCSTVYLELYGGHLDTDLLLASYGIPYEQIFRRDTMLMALRMANLDQALTDRLMALGRSLRLLPEEWPEQRLKTPEQQQAFLMGEYQRLWSGDEPPVPVILQLFAREDLHVMEKKGENFFRTSSFQFSHAMDYLNAFFHSWLRTLRELHALDSEVCLRSEQAILAVTDAFVREKGQALEEARQAREARRSPQPSLAERLSRGLLRLMGDPGKAAGGREQPASAMAQLQAMAGLQSVKEQVAELEAFIQVQRERQQRGLKTPPLTLHMVFTGNPGTGKTTVARIIAKLLHEMGLLKEDKMVETDRQHLVGEYLGHTAVKTQAVIDKAMGGVLFIDEAYTLRGDQYGDEAIATLLKNMEDHRDRFVVIVAGYGEPIRRMIDSNPGLRSRFSRYIDFPDYTAEELLQVLDGLCRANDYQLAEAAREPVQALLREMVAHRDESFANAREVRNLFDRARTRQTLRLRGRTDADTEAYRTLTAADFGIQDIHGGEAQ